MSSASFTGSYSGTSNAATLIASVFVRAAIADATINGDGKYPSSAA